MTSLGKIRLSLSLVFAFILSVSSLPSVQALDDDNLPPRYGKLRIIHTNDIHGHLFPFHHYGLGLFDGKVGGVARMATIIRDLRQDAEGAVLVMDAGDVFQRGPLADLNGVPDFAVLNAVPYDIMTIGNNEFTGAEGVKGQEILYERIEQAEFPVISANVIDESTGATIVSPYRIFDAQGIKVAVFGLTAPRVAKYKQAQGLRIEDPIATARVLVQQLQEEADFIVALTHIGLHLDLELARTVPEIDVIIGGDTHTYLFKPLFVPSPDASDLGLAVEGIIIAHAGEWATHVGKLDLTLRMIDNGDYDVANFQGELVPVTADVEPASDISNIVASYAKPYTKAIGRLDTSIPKENMADWVAECIRKVSKAQVAVMPEQGVENGLDAGTVTELDIRSIFPWVNQLVRVRVSGEALSMLITQYDVGLAGASVRDGKIYIADDVINNSQQYELAIEKYYASTLPMLAQSRPEEMGITTREVVMSCLSSGYK